MKESKQVTLHGSWASPYVYRVIWALKLKGITYDYIEEDLSNKTAALLAHNPVHKKVPVLVHGGKPVSESLVILDYIEDAWPHRPPLLPKDPHARATARFWLDFGQQKGAIFWAFFLSSEDDREENASRMVEALKIIQDEALGDGKFFGGEEVGVVDLYYGWLAHWLGIMEEIVGVGVLESAALPRLRRWAADFKGDTVIKENLPDRELLLERFKMLKKRFATDFSTTNNVL